MSEEGIQGRYNTELANDIGNLLSRTLGMIEKYCEGKVPEPHAGTSDPLRAEAEKLWPAYAAAMDALAFHEAIESILVLSRRANKYVDDSAPWKMAKDPSRSAELGNCLYTLAESLRLIAFCLSPFMPKTSGQMLAKLGLGEAEIDAKGRLATSPLEAACRFGALKPGTPVTKGEALFPRSEAATV